MAGNTLEQSLKLHDAFSSVLEKVESGLSKTLGTFEKFQGALDRDIGSSGTDKLQQDLEKTNQTIDKMSNQMGDLTSKMDEMANRNVNQPLIKPQPTVSALKQIDQTAEMTKGQLDEMYFKFEDQAGRAQTALDLVTDKMKLQAREISMLEKQLADAQVVGNDEKILKFEKALNRLETSYLSNINKADKYRDTLLGLENGMKQVETAQQQLGQGNGLDQQQSMIQRSIVLTQTLFDRFRQSNPVVAGVTNRISTMTNRIQQSTIAQSRFGRSVSQSVGFVGRLLGSTAKLPFAWMAIVPIIGRAINRQRQLRGEVDKTAQSQNKLNGLTKLMGFGAAIMGLRKINDLLNRAAEKADQIVQTMARLGNIVDPGQSVDQLSDRIMASAMDARSTWQETADFVAKVGQNAGEAFANNDEIVAFSNLLQKSYKAGGANAEEQRSSMTQLVQALQMGVLRGQELNSVMAGAPMVIDAITKHLGITKAELRDIASEGEISAEVIKQAMFAAADDINAKFAEIPMTWADMWTQTKNVALYAFLPLVEAFNAFINSAPGQLLFDHISKGFVMIADVAMWAFDLITRGLIWVQENINKVLMFLSILAGAIATVALIAAVSWAIANWQILLMLAIIVALIDMFDGLGMTADQVIGFIAGSFAFLAVVVYDVVLYIVGVFTAFFQYLLNYFVLVWNSVLDLAEFFMNVWTNPVYSTRKLFHGLMSNVLGFFGAIVDGAGGAGEAIADAFLWGVNQAIKTINWLMAAIEKIPFIGEKFIGGSRISEVSRDKSKSLGDSIRGLADRFDPGDAPDNYKSLDHLKKDMTPVDGLTNAISGLKNPLTAYKMAYEKASNLGNNASDFLNDFGGMVDEGIGGLNNIIDGLNGGAGNKLGGGVGDKLGNKLGKGKEIGDVGKIKSDVSITDEDLKYLRDIAERNFIIRYQQLTPNATVHLHGSGNNEQDAKKLLEQLEDMIEDATATNLA